MIDIIKVDIINKKIKKKINELIDNNEEEIIGDLINIYKYRNELNNNNNNEFKIKIYIKKFNE